MAAAVWAVQQPLDKLAFRSTYDDVELLGKALTRGDGWYALGLASHLANGALFGAAYARVSPALPLPPAIRGPVAALLEFVGTWPLAALADRFHPVRAELPALFGNRRAFWQSAYRHLLFGVVMGELERRINGGREQPEADTEAGYSSNGHGRIEHAVSVSTAPPSAR